VLNQVSIVQGVGPSNLMLATPTPALGGCQVHFSPPAITLGGPSGTRASRYHHGHQSHADSQANLDDLFIGSRGNVMADTHT